MMTARTPEDRASAFVTALDEPEILIVEDTEEPTALTPPAQLLELAAETRTGVTPPPAPTPLGPEAGDFAARIRFVLGFEWGIDDEIVDLLLERARSLMPRGRR